MVQRILSSPEFKMDPLVSLYYFAPACAAINGVFTVRSACLHQNKEILT